ncbi:hypothetical protein (plasmid) [Metabacillus dongyingensis]|nr:hypothetical protein [Metabacillus dongyingensis]
MFGLGTIKGLQKLCINVIPLKGALIEVIAIKKWSGAHQPLTIFNTNLIVYFPANNSTILFVY